jgi:hypothetical protein
MRDRSRRSCGVANVQLRQGFRLALSVRKGEQHGGAVYIRHLARLAFVSPRIITAIIDGTAAAGITATTLITGLSYSWAEQEQRISAHECQTPQPSGRFH